MPGGKYYKKKSSKTPKKARGYRATSRSYSRSRFQNLVLRAMKRNVETKQANITVSNGTEIQHNNFITVNSKLLATTQGTLDPMVSNILCRVGDEITLQGLSVRGMLELNSRYSSVYARVMVVKSAKNDPPSYSTLFHGISENKMLDRINTERYTVLKSMIVKLNSPNYGTTTSTNPADGAGFATVTASSMSRQTKIFKFWIPGSKFSKNSIIKYENGSDQPKFFDYHLLIFAFANESVSSLPGTPWNVCSLQDLVSTIYFKDA